MPAEDLLPGRAEWLALLSERSTTRGLLAGRDIMGKGGNRDEEGNTDSCSIAAGTDLVFSGPRIHNLGTRLV